MASLYKALITVPKLRDENKGPAIYYVFDETTITWGELTAGG